MNAMLKVIDEISPMPRTSNQLAALIGMLMLEGITLGALLSLI